MRVSVRSRLIVRQRLINGCAISVALRELVIAPNAVAVVEPLNDSIVNSDAAKHT